MATFRKQEDCPASQLLLAYQLGDLKPAESRAIGRHLTTCEFCTSEVAFYEHYLSREMDVSADESKMPEPLFELAEALLNRKRGNQSMDEMMKEIDKPLRERR
jgi:hypothetical protein